MKAKNGKPRVAHVSCAHPWTDNRIHFREAASLTDAGYHVTLVAVASAVDAPVAVSELIVLPSVSRVRRVLFGPIRAVRAALRSGADIYHLHDPELAVMIPLLRLLGKRVIYDAHEDLPVQVMSKAYLPVPLRPLARVAAQLVIALARTSDHVCAATETIAARFRSDRVTVIHNYPPLRAEEESPAPIMERSARAVYVGGVGLGRGAREMVETAGDEAFPDAWTLEIAGPSSASTTATLKDTRGWDQVLFHGQLPPEGARDLLLDSRLGLVLLQESKAYMDSLPTKMFEYFAAGVPVLASDFPLWRKIIVDLDCGNVTDQRSPTAIAEAIARYASDDELLRRQSENARRLAVERFNWGREVPALLSVYEKMTRR